jgi:hypothetical protein
MGMMLTYAVTSTNECYNYIGVMLMIHIPIAINCRQPARQQRIATSLTVLYGAMEPFRPRWSLLPVEAACSGRWSVAVQAHFGFVHIDIGVTRAEACAHIV